MALKVGHPDTERIRVLFVTTGFPPKDIGGAEIQASKQANCLQEIGCKVTVVTQSRNLDYSKEIVNGISVNRLPWRNGLFIGRVLNLITLVLFICKNGRNFDVFHVHLANLQADVCVFLGKILRVPTLVKVASGGNFGEISRFTSVARVTRFYGLRKATAIQSISEEIFTELCAIGVQESRIHRIPNGVAIEKSLSGRGKDDLFRQRYSIPLGAQIFLYAGRMAIYKGIDVLLEAWNLRDRNFDSILILVGPIALDRPFTPSSLPPDVIWVGETRDMSLFFINADVFVLPSFGEGMSNSLLEAISFRLPCIVTNVGSNRELIENWTGGLVVEPGTPTDLTLSINWMMLNRTARQAMSERSFESLQKYDIKNVAQKIRDLYVEIMAQ